MTREEAYKKIEEMSGLVPTFLKLLPDNALGLEWKLMKAVQFDEGPIPNKYRELIGLGIAATSKCRYCTLFHTEIAKLRGATGQEIEDAVHYAKSSAGWSAYLNGMQIPYEEFKKEIEQAAAFVRAKMAKQEAA
jgi:AhpD family alkylhydroperoxidase